MPAKLGRYECLEYSMRCAASRPRWVATSVTRIPSAGSVARKRRTRRRVQYLECQSVWLGGRTGFGWWAQLRGCEHDFVASSHGEETLAIALTSSGSTNCPKFFLPTRVIASAPIAVRTTASSPAVLQVL
jgi:hypothetical protein